MIIGLVNNMPDGALRATERQFTELLGAASDRYAERLKIRWIAVPGVPRTGAGLSYVRQHYEDVNQLWGERIDGLIVTGAEPRAATLEEEPYWPTLAKLVDWAVEHTHASIWSCLAAHAAAYHLDGITRRRLPEKLSGIFACEKTAEHPLVARLPPRWTIPHSRFNDLPADALVAAGYRVLSKLPNGSVDMFAEDGKGSLMLFMQGHPEYECGTLAREYQRDIGRFLGGERDSYPTMPVNYFDDSMVGRFEAFQRQVLTRRDAISPADIPVTQAREEPPRSWHQPAVQLYDNWLNHIRRRRLETIARQNSEPVS